MNLTGNTTARDAILQSIRNHLAASAPLDAIHREKSREVEFETARGNGFRGTALANDQNPRNQDTEFLIETFRTNLEAVGGHCIVARSEKEITDALTNTVRGLQESQGAGRRLALSNAPALERWVRDIGEEVAIAPVGTQSFNYDIGISTAQAAIAETGTLVLESEAEKHRLVSLVPPIHIAIVDANQIVLTLGEALAFVNRRNGLSPTITLITGPSRTADIELTLAIGVHGPQELHVIVNASSQ